MREVDGDRLKALIEEFKDEGERVGAGFAVTAVEQGEDEVAALVVPFGRPTKDMLLTLAEKAVEMVEALDDN